MYPTTTSFVSQTKKPKELHSFYQLAKLYCGREKCEAGKLYSILATQKASFNPSGWVLLESQQFDSSFSGQFTIVPFGPNNTLKDIPERPISSQDFESGMPTVQAILPADKLK